ncbi:MULTISPECIES: o-succinylbenzoate synthase [unclassified Luteococcus]|uniref:o-succinylbenzoate synthase n=1 Tax=unclassified Luteococcus TaxID=2639923 RepID=UPI00313B5F8C
MPTHVYQIPLRTRFRGITTREGVVFSGEAGWGEFSPFLDYAGVEIRPWLRAAREAADEGFPEPVRGAIPVNCTVPAVGPEDAHRIVRESGCGTAKVKVAEPGQELADDLARVEAVRDALGPEGKVRIDANGGWQVGQAVDNLRQLSRLGLEYAEQPVMAVEDLARLRTELARRGIDVPIAADESIRRSGDPERVKRLGAADIAVLKVQPLGGVRRCLQLAEDLAMPVVVSSALETSIGIRMGIALAAALPELPHACGLNTLRLFTDDLLAEPLIAVDGYLPVRDVSVDPARMAACCAPTDRVEAWADRMAEASR